MEAKRYSGTLRKIARFLSQHKNGCEMLRILANYERQDGTSDAGFVTACAVFWICNDYYDGQSDPLYSALCATRYRPGVCDTGPDEETTEHLVYQELQGLVA